MSTKAEKKILIIEDDEDLLLLYRLYLRGEAYQVREAHNGKEGLELAEKEKPVKHCFVSFQGQGLRT